MLLEATAFVAICYRAGGGNRHSGQPEAEELPG